MNFTLDLKSFRADERMALSLRAIYESYGYRPYKMSKFEEYELYSSNIDFHLLSSFHLLQALLLVISIICNNIVMKYFFVMF